MLALQCFALSLCMFCSLLFVLFFAGGGAGFEACFEFRGACDLRVYAQGVAIGGV